MGPRRPVGPSIGLAGPGDEPWPRTTAVGRRLEWQLVDILVVLELVAAPLALHARRLWGGATTAALHAVHATLGTRRAHLPVAPTVEHDHLTGDDLDGGALDVFPVDVLARLQPTFDVHLAALAQVLVA